MSSESSLPIDQFVEAAPIISLQQTVMARLNRYYAELNSHIVTGVYKQILAEVEIALLHKTLNLLHENQSCAALILGLSRGTLRKLLKKYAINPKRLKTARADVPAMLTTPLAHAVAVTAKHYYESTAAANNVHKRILAEIQVPMLQATLQFVRGNQSRAAIVLGLSRGTTRKLLKKYNVE